VFDRDLLPAEIPLVPPKQRLRPCCAFGYALRPELVRVPIPGVVLQNITSVSALGPHRYDSGVLARPADADQMQSGEENGQIYTCRGGFIDVAHVRDHADWVMFIAPALARRLEQGGTLELPDEGGRRRIVLQPIPMEKIMASGRRRIAVSMAEWLAYQLSIWHEIATWYGWSALPLIPERASSFSPEDLYSNALGARLAGGVIAVRAAATDRVYDRTLDRWIRAALEELGAVDAKLGMQAADEVDGNWWDSMRRVPDERLVKRRNFELALPVMPWTIGRSGAAARDWELAHCERGAAPLPLYIMDRIGTCHFSDFVRLEIQPMLPRLQLEAGALTQADFPDLVAAIRAEAQREFGPAAELADE
jgi:hypothetical protein